MKERGCRLITVLTLVLWILPLFVYADKKEDFSIIGVWMLKSETAPDGKVTPRYTRNTQGAKSMMPIALTIQCNYML